MSDAKKIGYILGLDVANSLKGLPVNFDVDSFSEGFRDMLNGENKLSAEEHQQALADLQRMIQAEQMKQQQAAAGENKAAGEAFLADNANRAEVTVTESGLQYEVLESAEGNKPSESDEVTVHYTGKLIDGTVFDSSVQRGTPATFPLNGVIRGWTEGVQLMSVGSKFRFFVPSDLAYGERGAGDRIGPNSTLVFDVELIDIKG